MVIETTPAPELVALLACPFCGGEAAHHDIGNAHTKKRATEIWCTHCFFKKKVGAIRESLEWTRSHAIAAWNTRAATVPQEVWLPIESAPKDGTAVLGYWGSSLGAHRYVTGRNYGITAFCQTTGEWYDASESDNEDDVWGKPDHWQPLPTPPPAELGRGS